MIWMNEFVEKNKKINRLFLQNMIINISQVR